MKRQNIISLALLLVCTWGTLQAQYSVIKPSEIVSLQRTKLDAASVNAGLLLPVSARGADEITLQNSFQVFETGDEVMGEIIARAPEVLRLQVPAVDGRALVLELVKVNITTEDFRLLESQQQQPVATPAAVHYQGVVAGEPGSLVAFSFWDHELSGLISLPRRGNMSLGKLSSVGARSDTRHLYVLYDDSEVFANLPFNCDVADTGVGYPINELREPDSRGPNDCVRVYFEVDHDIFLEKGSTAAAYNYVMAIFNQAHILYSNASINLMVSEIFVWSTPSPYNGISSSAMLTQFQNVRTSFNGNIGQLVSYRASGGIAVLSGLCHPITAARLSFASINSTYNNVPTYSFSVMVVAHELGHLLGSQHTHACVWNGNNTAIDGCAGFVEGSCSVPSHPSGGGTIMSYCHISQVGINFSLGFGPQPSAVMRTRIGNAACTVPCPIIPPNPPDTTLGCQQNKVFFRLVLDNFAAETRWELRNAQNTIVEQGGPYLKSQLGTIRLDTFCLPAGCYRFTILDSFGDGICCQYGNGSYSLRDAGNNVLASGGSFPASESTDFCLSATGGGGGNEESDCVSVQFNNFNIISYGTNQDGGTHQLQDEGNTLYLQNNAWKAIMLNYTVTPNTKISFDFRSTVEGEVHGLGFDNNDVISFNQTFKVHGNQAWGVLNYDNYPNNGSWMSYTIPVGQFYTGQFDRLFFTVDNDSGARTSNGWFRNVKIFEGTSCEPQIYDGRELQGLPAIRQSGMQTFPNPASSSVELRVPAPAPGEASWEIVSLTGQRLHGQLVPIEQYLTEYRFTISLAGIPAGVYLLRWRDQQAEQTVRFTVQ